METGYLIDVTFIPLQHIDVVGHTVVIGHTPVILERYTDHPVFLTLKNYNKQMILSVYTHHRWKDLSCQHLLHHTSNLIFEEIPSFRQNK